MRLLTFCFIILTQSVLSQSISIKDISFKGGYYFGQSSESSFLMIYKTLSPDKTKSVFRKLDINNRLSVTDTSLITLRGSYKLVTSATGIEYAACVFTSPATQSVILYFNGKNNYERSVPLKLLVPWNKKMTMLLHPSAKHDEFYVIYDIDDSNWELLCYNIAGEMRWKKRISGGTQKLLIQSPMNFGTDLMLLTRRDNYKKPKYDLTLIDHSTGEVKRKKPLAGEEENLGIDNLIYQDSTLYITGRKFVGSKVNDKYTGTPFAKYLKRGMDAPEDIKLHNSLAGMYFYWMDMATDSEGKKYLVGETFKAESSGTHTGRMVATGILTLGMLMVTWQNMHLNDIIIYSLDHADPLPKIMKFDSRKVTVGSYLKPYEFIRYAVNTGQVRYLGNSDSGDIFIASGSMVKRHDLHRQITSDAAYNSTGFTPIVVFSSDRYFIVLNQVKSMNLVELRLLNLQ